MQARLNKLLSERAGQGADKSAIDAQIWELYGEEWAVMFTDLAGFSRRVAEFGVCHFLQIIYESFRVYVPILEQHNGVMLKFEGDSMMVLFRKPQHALRAALAMQLASREYNRARPEAEQLVLSVGLGWGKLLKFGDQDVYGQEVNIACKLGEDLGQHGSIQCSEAFHSAVKTDPQYRFEPMNVAPSGAKPCWKLAY
jgi:class 3 adenylate cyclase